MAKPKNDAPIFVEPEFNEKTYIREERDRAKSTILVFLLGIGSGLLEGFLQLEGLYYLSALLLLFLMYALFRLLKMMGLRVPERNSHKFYMIMVLLLTSILFWSVALNPPLSVNTSPSLSLEIMEGGKYISVGQSNGEFILPVNQSVLNLRDQIYFVQNVTVLSISIPGSSVSGIIKNSHQFGNTEYINMTTQPVDTLIPLAFYLESGGRYFNETQTLYFK
ncbi:MAG: hypothetical protein M1375_01375 [Candidatus Thermoplasmatota archaeon]|nr:hypothetical protein [Candidatus Thermoplasmatota archaeon]MCL5790608.1 hypothetical protein [Candidatus Thermoplasmatota archaeon]